MKPAKTGDVLRCPKCGVEVTVTKDCGCNDCNIICCGQPMTPVKDSPKSGSCCCCG